MGGLVHAHSGLRWIVLATLLYAIFNAFKGKSSTALYQEKDRKISLIAFIAVHIQITLGTILALWNPNGKVNFSGMSNPFFRFYSVEHLTGMLIAMALITVGYVKSKKLVGTEKGFQTILLFYVVGLLLILASIPWPFREALGGHWF